MYVDCVLRFLFQSSFVSNGNQVFFYEKRKEKSRHKLKMISFFLFAINKHVIHYHLESFNKLKVKLCFSVDLFVYCCCGHKFMNFISFFLFDRMCRRRKMMMFENYLFGRWSFWSCKWNMTQKIVIAKVMCQYWFSKRIFDQQISIDDLKTRIVCDNH